MENLCVLQRLNEMTSDPKETSVTIQDVDRGSMKYMKTEREDPSWAAQEGQLTSLSGFQPRLHIRYAIDGEVYGYFCLGSGGRTYPH